MIEEITELLGQGKNLTTSQMSFRAVVVFVVCLLLIRISGRRSFGMRMPLDNVIAILLGAILSRAIVGASPFIATIASATTLAILHRVCGWIGFYNRWFGKMLKGTEMVLYSNGKMHKENMERCMVTERDLMEGLKMSANLNSLEKVESAYMGRNGQISVIKKEET